jgi:hypothetical protein
MNNNPVLIDELAIYLDIEVHDLISLTRSSEKRTSHKLIHEVRNENVIEFYVPHYFVNDVRNEYEKLFDQVYEIRVILELASEFISI